MMSDPPLRRDEALNLTFRTGDLQSLQRSTHDEAVAAVEAGDFDRAAELTAYVIEEGLEPQEVFAGWAELIPDFLRRNGVEPAVVETEIARARDLIRHADGSPFDFVSGWERYRSLVEVAVGHCRLGDANAAIATIREAAAHWRADHDRKCDWVCELLAAIPRHLGEEKVVEFWDEGMAVWYGNYSRFAPERQPWAISYRQLIDMAILALRGHMPGPRRNGEIIIEDEGDCIALRFAPCGSGGRTLDEAPDGTPPRLEPPYGHVPMKGRHDWGWNRPGVCLYCTHCCRLGQQKAIETIGFPARVIDPPVWPRDRGRSVCTWRIYKDPSLIPAVAFTEVGAVPPGREPALAVQASGGER